MGRCNPVAERWPAPADPFVRPNEKKANQIYVSYAAATAGIRLYIPRTPPEMLAAMLTNDCKPSHGIKSFDYHPLEKYGFCIPLGSSFSPPRNPAKSGYDSVNGVKRPPPPKHHYVDAQPTIPPPPYSDRVPPHSTVNTNIKFQGPKSDVAEGKQLTNAGSSCGTRQIDQVDEPPETGTKLETGSTTDGSTTVELQVHSTQSSAGEFVTIKIEDDDTKEADFKISGVGNITGAPIPVSHHSATDSKGDAGGLENYAKCSSDPTSDHGEFTGQPIPAQRPDPTALSGLPVQHLLAESTGRLSKIIQVMIKYSRILQNLRNHDCQRPGVSSGTPTARPATTSPHTWRIRKWLALGSMLLYYSLGRGTGGFDSQGFAHTSNSSQTPGSPNIHLGDIGGDIWSGRGPDFQDFTLLGLESPSSLEELFGSFGRVPDISARSPYGPTNHSPVGQPESRPIPPPPLDSETLCAKSYNDGFNDAMAMIFAGFQSQAPSTQSNPMATNETLALHHPPPSFTLPKDRQNGAGFPPNETCPRPNMQSTISPLENGLLQDLLPRTAHQAISLDLDANPILDVEMPQLEPSSQPQYSETDRDQSAANPARLAPPTNTGPISVPVPPFSHGHGAVNERQPSRVILPTSRRATQRHQCTQCPKFYPKPYQLRDHIKCKHEGGVKSYCCGHGGCGKAFTTRSNLMRHSKKEHRAGNTSAVPEIEGHALEASNEPAQAAGPSTRRAADPFVVCTPGAMRRRRHRREQ